VRCRATASTGGADAGAKAGRRRPKALSARPARVGRSRFDLRRCDRHHSCTLQRLRQTARLRGVVTGSRHSGHLASTLPEKTARSWVFARLARRRALPRGSTIRPPITLLSRESARKWPKRQPRGHQALVARLSLCANTRQRRAPLESTNTMRNRPFEVLCSGLLVLPLLAAACSAAPPSTPTEGPISSEVAPVTSAPRSSAQSGGAVEEASSVEPNADLLILHF
jgi:hypothetical protein